MPDGPRHWVAVPDPARGALLVTHGSSGQELPSVEAEGGPAGMLAALEDAYGLRAAYLRPARVVLDEEGRPSMALRELDAPQPGWQAPRGLEWLALEQAVPAAIAPAELAPQLARWLEEQRSGRIPAKRPAWARPGWLADASGWMREKARASGLEPAGKVELVAQWPISSVLKLPTSGGNVFFKAVFVAFFHEPRLTSGLATDHSDLVPELVAVDHERGWMLMRELQGEQIGGLEAESWVRGLEAIADFHRRWAGRDRELAALGVPNRSLGLLPRRVSEALDSIELDPAVRRRAIDALPDLERLAGVLEGGPLSETLIHGDLHPGNVMSAGGAVRIFDWSDGAFSHPLVDLPTYLAWAEDGSARERLLEAYLDCWADVAPSDELHALATAAAPLAHAYHALSYLSILEALEDADHWWFADEPRRWLLGAVERVEAMKSERAV